MKSNAKTRSTQRIAEKDQTGTGGRAGFPLRLCASASALRFD
jgi:hypothetical protein